MKKLILVSIFVIPQFLMGMLSVPEETTRKYSMLSTPLEKGVEDYSNISTPIIEEKTPNTVQLGPIKTCENFATITVPNGLKNQEECQEMQTQIIVPIWVLNNNNEKESSTMSLTINKDIALDLLNIFTEIYNGKDQQVFNPSTCGGFCYRNIAGTNTLSHHSYGTAIDLNWDANPCYYYGHAVNDNIGKNPYAFHKDGDVVQIFKSHGWDWGGEWSHKTDFMHFSCSEK